MTDPPTNPNRFVDAIRRNELTIYDPVEIADEQLWIPTPELQRLLNDGLRGISLAQLPLRTRSKVVKQHICRILGDPVPQAFQKTQPRFPGQRFDTYIQKSNNLQVWNEEVASSRRYVLIRVSDDDVISQVKVVTGETLTLWDTTGTLTQKYQARCVPGEDQAELITRVDTNVLCPFVHAAVDLTDRATPISDPSVGELLPIAIVFDRLKRLSRAHFC